MASASSSSSLVLPLQPPPTNRQSSLDGLRGIACLGVYSVHTGLVVRFPGVTLVGWTGVHLFFVLSGYLISKPFLRSLLNNTPLPRFQNYALRRLLRIYPPYIVSLVIFLVLRYLTRSKSPDALNLFSHIFLIFNYFRSVEMYGLNAVYWSLAIEAQYYLLLPFVAALIRRSGISPGPTQAGGLVGLFLLVGIASRFAEVHWNGWQFAGNTPVRFRTVFSYLDLFGFGMLVALLDLSDLVRRFITPARATAIAACGLVVFIAANDWSAHNGIAWQEGSSIFYLTAFPVLICAALAALMLGILMSPALRRPLSWRPLVWVGEISYSIYLYHLVILVLLFRTIPMPWLHGWTLRASVYTSIGLVPTLLLSWVMFELIERPSLKLAARFRR